MLPEEYEDPDDEDVFLNDVMDQKVRVEADRDASRSASDARVFETFRTLVGDGRRGARANPPARLDDARRARHARLADPTAATFRTNSENRTPPNATARSSRTPSASTGNASRPPWTPRRTPSCSSSWTSTTSSASRTPCSVRSARPGPAAMLRIFGVTAGGNSGACTCTAEPYFYAKVPDWFADGMCEGFRKNLNEVVSQQQRGGGPNRSAVFISAVEVVREAVADVLPGGKASTFVEIACTLPNCSRRAAFSRSRVCTSPACTTPRFASRRSRATCCTRCGSWWTAVWWRELGELPAGGYAHRRRSSPCASTSAACATTRWYRARQRASTASSRRSAFCPWISSAGRKGHFPDAEHDPVIQIATMVTCQGDDKPRSAPSGPSTRARPSSGRTC